MTRQLTKQECDEIVEQVFKPIPENPPLVSTYHDGKGGIDIKIDDWVYVHINYDYQYTDNASRAWLAREIVALLMRKNNRLQSSL